MRDSSDNVLEVGYQLPVEDDEVVHTIPSLTTHQARYDVLILEAKLRQSLVTARSLGSRGLRVAGLETSDGVPTFWSRWCQQGFVCATDGSAKAMRTNAPTASNALRLQHLDLSLLGTLNTL